MSAMTDEETESAVREFLDHRGADATFRFTLNDEEVEDLAAGIVPKGMAAICRRMLDFDDYIRRNAIRNEERYAAKQAQVAPRKRKRA